MSRRLARELVLHMLFSNDFIDESADAVLETSLAHNFDLFSDEHELYRIAPAAAQDGYIHDAFKGIMEHMPELDMYIEKYAVGWSISRMSRLTRCILRLCMYEMLYMQVPVGASVNEGVELAKKYDSEESASFINGILGAFVAKEMV
ncbi:MAG: transcription antitermination factor NusB [Clostridia bacterium]|nr:transcription antitermination factor NusB [Clostridia bacterium]MBQ3091694.1 transcription antitermination factor NusB [Clostridia bacterium]MBQ9925542.1 transcription antitermination factor NusB [Clostridia bacterium]